MNRRLSASLALLAFSAVTAAARAPDTTVNTNNGRVNGVLANGSIIAFKGIPYAAPPVDDLRWRPPQPAASWTDLRSAAKFAPGCEQNIVTEHKPWTHEFMTAGEVSEDCLYLNVWTPGIKGKKRPVFIFIHGGAFVEGSGAVPIYDGVGLASKGLVAVTINYRLGIFGFFAYPELTRESPRHASGNYGLLDQVAALRWVHDNIAQFGGDPNNVTICGQSAGAASVIALTASPLARGLFQRAIAESGVRWGGLGLVRPKTLAEEEQSGVKFAESKGFHSLADLRRATPKQLAAPPFRFGPIIDGYLLPEPIEQVYTEGQQNDVPILTGWTKDDIGVISNPKTTLESFKESAMRRFAALAEEFLAAYPAENDEQARRAETEASRDQMRVATYLWALKRDRSSQMPAYTYYWTHALPGPDAARFGAFHSSELPYVLNTLAMSDRPFTPLDHDIAETVSQYWANFAAKGDPNGRGLADWSPVTKDSASTMQIGDDPGMIPVAADAAKLEFWRKYLEPPQGASQSGRE